MTKIKSIAIVGSGAMACLFASAFADNSRAQGGPDSVPSCFMLGSWPEQLDSIQSGGLRVTYPNGDGAVFTLNITNDAARIPAADLVLVLVKGYQTKTVSHSIARFLKPNGLVITLQNGWGNRNIIEEKLGHQRIVQGTTSNGAELLRPGLLRIAGIGKTILPKHTSHQLLIDAAASLFTACGLPTEVRDDNDMLIWQKLAVNAAINPLSALSGLRNGELFQSSAHRTRMINAAQEVVAVAARLGIMLDETTLTSTIQQVCEATATNRSSMLQDILRGRPTEIASICGAVVALGKQHGTPVRENEQLLREVTALEARAASSEEYSLGGS